MLMCSNAACIVKAVFRSRRSAECLAFLMLVDLAFDSRAVQLHNVLRAISEEMIVLERDKVAIAARTAEAELEYQRARSDVQSKKDGE